MRTPRIFTHQPLAENQPLVLEAPASRHLATVLRLKPGAPLVLFDGSGQEFEARLESITGQQVHAVAGNRRANHSESPLHITLVQGISRGEHMDYTLQKAVELGVTEIAPLLTERSVVRLNAEQAQRKRARWQQLVIGACEQSGRALVPRVRTVLPFAEYLSQPPPPGLELLLDPAADAVVNELAAPEQNRVWLLAGPEGGLTDTEIAQAVRAGFQRVRIGPRILRTETAALVALSLLQARWGDLTERRKL